MMGPMAKAAVAYVTLVALEPQVEQTPKTVFGADGVLLAHGHSVALQIKDVKTGKWVSLARAIPGDRYRLMLVPDGGERALYDESLDQSRPQP